MGKSIVYGIDDIENAAKFIMDNMVSNILLFEGDMGSGKTTLIKELSKLLGAQDEVSSPTFSLVNEYFITDQKKIYHFDLYRLNDEFEALDFGFEEYLDQPMSYVFIEWPDLIMDLLPKNSQKIRIIVKDFQTRELQII